LTGRLGTLGRTATTVALPISGYSGALRASARSPWNSEAFISIRLLLDQSSSRSFSRLMRTTSAKDGRREQPAMKALNHVLSLDH
jgi:hypothetical protein